MTWQHMVLSARDYAIPSAKYAWFLLMDAKTRMASLIIIFAVRPICVQDSIFKMSSESPGTDRDGVSFVRIWVKIDVITVPLCFTKHKAWPYHDPYFQCYPIPAVQIRYSIRPIKRIVLFPVHLKQFSWVGRKVFYFSFYIVLPVKFMVFEEKIRI